MVTVFDNFTISKASFPESVGNNVVTDNPQAILLITPNLGYSVSAQDFNFTTPLPNHVASVSFTQVGSLVECIVTFSNPFIMPANDVEIGLCLTGLAKLVKYSVTGQINITKTNAASSPANLSFNISENFNHTTVVKTLTLTANSSFYFPVEPTLIQTVGDNSIFSITDSKVFDINGNLLSKTFTISCTMPNYNSLGNIFEANAIAFAIPVPIVGLTNYILNVDTFPLIGGTTTLTLYGTAGSNWNLSSADPILQTGPRDPVTGIIPYGTTTSGVIDSSGQVSISVNIGSKTTEDLYSITVGGDLSVLFVQPNPILLYQFGDITVTYRVNPSSYFTNNGDKFNVGVGLSSPASGVDGSANDFNWNIDSSAGYELLLVKQPLTTDFNNLDPLLNGGNVLSISTVSAVQTSGVSIVLNMTGSVESYGINSMLTAINMEQFIAYVDTADPSNVAATTATSGGSVVFTGSGGVMGIKGLCYSTSPLPTIADMTMPASPGFGSFTSNLIGLSNGTPYYTRAYAYDSTNTIVSYGPEKTFTTIALLPPTVTTTTITNITDITATSGGNVTSDGNATVTARGICWSFNPNPTIADSITTNGSGTGVFVSGITGLAPSTTYNVRAYATNSEGTSYGNNIPFTTLAPPITAPTVVTASVTNAAQTTADSGGISINANGGTISSRGVEWSATQNFATILGSTSDGTGTSNFTSAMTGLTANTTYWVRAYVTNEVATGYGTPISFITAETVILNNFDYIIITYQYNPPTGVDYDLDTLTTFRYPTSTLAGSSSSNTTGFIPGTGVVGCGAGTIVPPTGTLNSAYLYFGGDDVSQSVDGAYGESVVINFKNLSTSGLLTSNDVIAEGFAGWHSGTAGPYPISIKYETFIGGTITRYTTPGGVLTNRFVSDGTVVAAATISDPINAITGNCGAGVDVKRRMASIAYNVLTDAASITFLSYP